MAAALAPAHDIYRLLWSNTPIRQSMFRFLTEMKYNLFKYEPSSQLNDANKVKVYMKGGNAIACLQHEYLRNTYPFFEKHIPPPMFPSDFDYTILISPYLEKADYDTKQANCIFIVIKTLLEFMNNPIFFTPFLPFCAGIDLTTPNKIIIQDMMGIDEHSSKPNPELNALIASLGKEMPPNSPFQLSIRTNTIFGGQLLNIGAVILKLRNTENTELFDISFTLWDGNKESETYKTIKRDWDMTQLLHYSYQETPFIMTPHGMTQGISLQALIYDPLTAYVNMRIAANRNTRPNKRAKRTFRANILRNNLLKKHANLRTRRNAVKNILKNTKYANVLNNIE